MPKNKSVTVNGLSINADHYKGKTEKEFVDHEKHNFNGDEAKTKETWKLFQDSQKPKAEEKKA